MKTHLGLGVYLEAYFVVKNQMLPLFTTLGFLVETHTKVLTMRD